MIAYKCELVVGFVLGGRFLMMLVEDVVVGGFDFDIQSNGWARSRGHAVALELQKVGRLVGIEIESPLFVDRVMISWVLHCGVL